MLDLIHEAPHVIAFRDIHGEPKNPHFLLRPNRDLLAWAKISVDGDFHLFFSLFGEREMNGGGVLLVVDELQIVIFNSHVGHPISCMVPVSTALWIYLLELHLLLPALCKQLVLYLCL